MDGAAIDGLPLDRAPVEDIDGCPMGWEPLDGVTVDDIDGVPLGHAIDDIDGMPCESTIFPNSFHRQPPVLLFVTNHLVRQVMRTSYSKTEFSSVVIC